MEKYSQHRAGQEGRNFFFYQLHDDGTTVMACIQIVLLALACFPPAAAWDILFAM